MSSMSKDQNGDREPSSTGVREITDGDLITEFQRVVDELGKTPTREEMDEHSEYSISTYRRRFGSWNEAVAEAGFEPRRWGPDLEFEWETHEEWLNNLVQDCTDDLLQSFEQLGVFGQTDAEALAEATFDNIERFLKKEGAEFLSTPQYVEEDASEPERGGLARLTAGAFLSASRELDLPIRVDEVQPLFSRHSGFDIEGKTISKFKRRVDGAAGQWVSPPPVEQFLQRYAVEIGVHPDTLDAALSVSEDLSENMDPNVAATTALWLGSRQTKEPMRRKTLLEMADVSGPAVRKAIPEDYDYDKPGVRFGRKIGEGQNVTIPQVIVDWLDLDGKYVSWPDPDEPTSCPEGPNSIRSISQAIVCLDVSEEKPESNRVGVIKQSPHATGVWEFDVPDEFVDHLPEVVLLSWQWDWDQNSGQLILRDE